jgi:Holliday junction resolvase
MANPSKQKGTAAETALLRWLLGHGREARRNPPSGNKDVGDLVAYSYDGDTPTIIEVKNMADVARAINEGIAELEAEKTNAGTGHGVLVVKRRGKGDPGEWLAIRKVKDDPEIGQP